MANASLRHGLPIWVAIFIFQLVAVSGFSQKSPNKAVDRGIPHSKQVLDSIVILNKQVLYFEKKGDSRNKILALLQCSNLYTKTNQLDQALIFSNSALMESQESNDDYGKMRSLIEMGNCYYNLNFKAEALESFLQAFQLSKELKITDATSYLIAQLGKVELELGSFVNAMDYHTPFDDADKINYIGLKKSADYIYQLAITLANKSQKLTFKEAGPKSGGDYSRGKRFKVTLGIMPDISGQSNDGLRADFVTNGKPAYRGGMQNGDVITAIDGKEVKNIQDYMARLMTLKEGQTISVEVRRNNEQKILIIKL